MQVYVSVRNFGKIKEARVNISSFTVFVGNNNSGKTQLMELIYAVLNFMTKITPQIELNPTEFGDGYHVAEQEIKNLNEVVNEELDKYKEELVEETFNSNIPIEKVWLDFEDIDASYDLYLMTQKSIDFLDKEEAVSQNLMYKNLRNVFENTNLITIANKKGGKKLMSIAAAMEPNGVERMITGTLQRILCDLVGVKARFENNLLFLPASRMGLMLLYKYYFGNNPNENEVIWEKNHNSKGITRPVLDFLSFLLKYSYTERIANKNTKLLEFIYENLIDGRISEKGEMTFYSPKDQNKEIPIFVASSMVNEIVPVVKALTDSNSIDYIFYDEVETSLHPRKQIEMVRLLNRLNNAGFKLIISTHSDTMATKINNLLLLSDSKENFKRVQEVLAEKDICLNEEDLLDSQRLHVYQFINDGKGKSLVEELKFSKIPYTGYEFTLFNDSSIDLYEEAKAVMGFEDDN